MTTAYERIGGEAAVRSVLTKLYDSLFEDPIVGFLFAGKDKLRIVEQQVVFTCRFLGGPQRYVGKSLPEAHSTLPLLPGHFDRRHFLLAQLLEKEGIAADIRSAWLTIDEGLRGSVLAAGGDARARTHEPG
jgi:hemoglobin